MAARSRVIQILVLTVGGAALGLAVNAVLYELYGSLLGLLLTLPGLRRLRDRRVFQRLLDAEPAEDEGQTSPG